MTTALFLLRCTQVGLRINDLDYITMGMAYDMMTEAQNDDYDYPYKATLADIKRL